jgi:Holliday junction resolvase RusA-like endonuclease
VGKSFSFVVPGEPIGQGSMKHIGAGRMIASNDKKLRIWRKAIVDAIQSKLQGEEIFFDGPTKLEVHFCIERPKTVKRDYPTTPYDADKLVRAVGDGCTDSGVIYDDAIFVDIVASKRYGDGCPFGAHITISEL